MIRKVLFILDDEAMSLAIRKKFTKHSELFTMAMARDRVDAVKTIQRMAISLVVVDLDVPHLDGRSLLAQLQQEYSDIPVIIVASQNIDEMSVTDMEKGVAACIAKPFEINDLGNAILTILQNDADGGIMHNVSPVMFLQLIQMEGKTCTIRLIDGVSHESGTLYFKDGLMVDARAGRLRGIQAAYKAVNWENVTLFIKNKCVSRKNVINRSLQAIILKAVNLKDEFHDRSAVNSTVDRGEDNQHIGGEAENLQGDMRGLGSSDKLENVVLPDLTEDSPEDKDPFLADLKKLIREQVGERCGVESIYHDDDMDNTVQFLTELGAMFRIGAFTVGHIDQGKKSNKIILPGDPISVLDVSKKCPYDSLMQVLVKTLRPPFAGGAES